MESTKEWLHAPKQDRSQQTTARIRAAALEAFAEERFDTVSVSDLARRAGVSVGGFYARFKNKGALLHELDECVLDEMLHVVRRAMDPGRLDGAALAEVVETYVRTMIGFFARRRGLSRQIVIRARTTEDAGFLHRMQEFNAEAHGLFAARLLERRREIRCPDPESAIQFAIMMVSAAAREAVLFGERKMNLSTARGRALVESLVRAFLAYLGARNALHWTADHGTKKQQ
jgi:AcrR family transcriptional regulator